MLACLQRQNQQQQQFSCATRIRETPQHTNDLTPACPPRYPSAADLDAYMQRTSHSPLTIRIFPSSIRVPQHKQINRTVNGLDTRLNPYPHQHPRRYQGLLAVAKTHAQIKEVLKSHDGKLTKFSPVQQAAAPYAPLQHREYVAQHTTRPSNPSILASCADAGLAVTQSGHYGAVLPTQSADVAGSDYCMHQHQTHGVRISPEVCYRTQGKLSSSPAVREFSTGQFLAPAWPGVLVTPDSECFKPPALPADGSTGLGKRPVSYPCFPRGLSSSLRSLESLISGIHPACIKERMLGRGFESIPPLVEPPHTHMQLHR
ncbi:protein FAM222A [Danio aesculapii]|uniref:protein FAM222A n=1 Tax=Danio aesculapii TaxID=1142201 RepID=UPI0024BFF905|nr:protein FAM222A [Danio aesculapii]